MTEEKLIERIKNDDKSAFESLFRMFYPDLCRFCVRYVRDEIIAEEIVQEVYINIWDRRFLIEINTSVKAYLYTAVKNRSFNYLKLQLPKEQNKVELEHIAYMEVDGEDDDQVKKELYRQINLAIDRLPNKCKIIFSLSKNSGMTYKEIAEELDISVKTVENQVGHALRKLRAELNPLWNKIIVIIIILFV
ncbi:RNA polymerase sigma-70 factor [Reichenbachiella versicolor]|uniref:RNA polymerase sigma-70 factor n=1 Tax=Reichenbachiella versicolor TaxID=1821036 RepID=UPI000D6E3B81|nr:RNA polymerase sigma-70 factor [Reichenbachiella versicolor]